jgi:hypothetical protein
LISNIKLGTRKLEINDEQLANALLEACDARTKNRSIHNKRDAEAVVYVAHV